jgi:hypothetical protein
MKRDLEHERVLSIVFNLSPAQASVLSALVRGTVIPAHELLEYTGVKPPIKVVVSHTRTKLRTHGFDIKSRLLVGYWMDPDDKAGVEQKVMEWVGR